MGWLKGVRGGRRVTRQDDQMVSHVYLLLF